MEDDPIAKIGSGMLVHGWAGIIAVILSMIGFGWLIVSGMLLIQDTTVFFVPPCCCIFPISLILWVIDRPSRLYTADNFPL